MRALVLANAGEPFPGSAFPSPLYRIPALAVAPSGRILLAHDVRADWRDLPADFDIALRISDDEGLSWSEPKALRRHSPGHGFGDPSFLVDPATARILCWHVGSTGESYFSARADGPGLELWLSTSEDEGETWVHEDLSHLRPEGVAGMFCASGNGAVLADGSLIQPFVARIDDSNHAICARSTDHGRTWTMGRPVGPDCDESKVVGLPGDEGGAPRVLMHSRATPRRRQSLSSDGGRTFCAPEPATALVDPACNGGLARIGGLLIASMCDDPVGRGRLSVRLSTDEGASWSGPILLDEGASAYSVVVPLDDSRLVAAWEADDYRAIAVGVIGLDELGVSFGPDGVPVVDPSAATLRPRRGAPGFAKPPVVNPATDRPAGAS